MSEFVDINQKIREAAYTKWGMDVHDLVSRANLLRARIKDINKSFAVGMNDYDIRVLTNIAVLKIAKLPSEQLHNLSREHPLSLLTLVAKYPSVMQAITAHKIEKHEGQSWTARDVQQLSIEDLPISFGANKHEGPTFGHQAIFNIFIFKEIFELTHRFSNLSEQPVPKNYLSPADAKKFGHESTRTGFRNASEMLARIASGLARSDEALIKDVSKLIAKHKL